MDLRYFLLITLCFLIQSSHGGLLTASLSDRPSTTYPVSFGPIGPSDYSHVTAKFPQWGLEPSTSWQARSLKAACFAVELACTVSSSPLDPTWVTQISWKPRAFLYRGFLTNEECDHFITLAQHKLEKSMVADNDSGQSVESEVRTSSGMFLSKGQDGIVAGVEAKIAAWTFLPIENGEAIQILHYEHGQKYEPHFDYFHDAANQKLGGHRVATVLVYLSDVAKGGETVFPDSEEKAKQPKGEDWSECAKEGYAVKPQKGDALLFFSLHPDATTDESSLHGSCPVIEGEKWSATKWIHVRSFDTPSEEDSRSSSCVDENPNCIAWALIGECEKNPSYMVGSESTVGYCRKSCKVCSS